jgi:hypothetical protein
MKDLVLLFSQLLAQHAWIKYAIEVTLLTLGGRSGASSDLAIVQALDVAPELET